MLALTGPRIQTGNAGRYTELRLDGATRAKAADTFARALEGGQCLTRLELGAALRRARIDPGGQRLAHLLFHAELEGLICSGPRVGKQLTYASIDARVAVTPPTRREDALATLVSRYFTSHGPATVRGRRMVVGPDARRRPRRHRAGRRRARTTRDRTTEYWRGSETPSGDRATRPMPPATHASVHLLPSYDEYTVAYRDRTALLHTSTAASTVAQSALLLQPVVLDGRHIGTWRRSLPTRADGPVRIDVQLLQALTGPQRRALGEAVERYGMFLNRAVSLSVS